MGFRVVCTSDEVRVVLSGIDRLLNLTSSVAVAREHIEHVRVVRRSELEPLVDHRVVGVGGNVGERWPNRRRVGTMMGRGVIGRQFWAVSAGAPDQQLVVIDTDTVTEPARLVLEVANPDEIVAALR